MLLLAAGQDRGGYPAEVVNIGLIDWGGLPFHTQLIDLLVDCTRLNSAAATTVQQTSPEEPSLGGNLNK